ncbi:MAG: hypothetical protein AAGF11_04250 [Myxococcota bacterium]
MRRLASATLLFATVLLSACQPQPLPPDKAEYAGHWRGGGVDLVIYPEGRAEYTKQEGKGTIEVSGPVGWKGEDFVIAVMVVKTKFDVQQPPHEVDGIWMMTVDGIELTRVQQ